MKKVFTYISMLVFLLMLPVLPVRAQAAEVEGSYTNIMNHTITWAYDTETKTVTVGGQAELLRDPEIEMYPWDAYAAEIETFILEEGITSVSTGMMQAYTSLKTVHLPSTVGMMMSVFADCASLETVVLADGLDSIDGGMFRNCAALRNIVLPASMQIVEIDAFSGCYGIEAFQVAEGNSTLSVGEKGELIKDGWLLEVPAGVTGDYVVPSDVTDIYSTAFELCREATSITIPDTIESLNFWAFKDCPVPVVVFQGNAPDGFDLFGTCGVETVYYPTDNETWTEEVMKKLQNRTDIEWVPECCREGHSWSEWSVVSEATASAAGEKIRSCGTCGKEETEMIPATGETEPVVPPTEDNEPIVPPTEDNEPIVPPTEDNEPIVPPTEDNEPIVPPTEDNEPIVPPTEDNEPVTPPAEDEEPVAPPDKPIGNPFADVSADAYYYDAVLWAVEEGITTGMSATAFAPDGTCTRGQIVTFLWRANGSPDPTSDRNPFQDVTAADYYYKAVLWAVEQGITTGMSETTFAPDASCTRGQVATFLHRSQGKAASDGENTFSDIASGAYYYDAVLWAVENNITNGMGNGTFAPDAPCTRGQIVTFLFRTLA